MNTALWRRVILLFTTASSLAFGVVSPPVLSPGEGDSFTQFSLKISATPGAEIHYTLSGADPTKYDPLITSGSAIVINRNWTVKAKAWLGAEASATSIGNYLLTSDIAAGNAHSLALKSTGELRAWGLNDARLGNLGTFGNQITPALCRYGQTSFVYDAAMVGAGGSHTVFLKNNGTVWSFGSNSKGELGNNTTTASGIAVQVRGPGSSILSSCVAVAAGNGFSLALQNYPEVNIMGYVYAWGDLTSGRLGNGRTSGTQIYPFPVYMGPSGYTRLTGINRISAGSAFALAKEPCAKETAGANGYVWVWGDNASGQLGQGNTTMLTLAAKMKLSNSVFLTDALDVSCKEAHSAIVRWKDGDPSLLGRVYCCGQQSYGRLGNNLTTTASVTYPVVVVKSGGIPLDGIISVAAGSAHTLALDVNGNVWAWGCNDKGALGDNTVTSRGTAAKVKNTTGTGDLSNIVRIAAGGVGLLGHSMAVAADGTVYTWGYNGNGQLGSTAFTGATMLPIAAPSSLKLLPQPPDTTLTHAITKASAPGAVTLTAKPTDPNNDITLVEFYSQGVRVGVAGAPWKINLTNLSAGSYHTYAVVTDAANSLGYSLPCDFTILPASKPTVSLACAVTAGMFPGAVTLSATPSDPDGDLNRVEYFLDGIKVGQSVASPWVMNLSNLKVGNHTVYAVAKDSYGLTGTSQTLPFTIIYDPTLDSDGDGLFDFTEDAIGTSPVKPDTDGDGMPDGWEVKYNLNPKNPTDATADADLDGITNLNEYLSGKNPIVAEDADQDGVPDYIEIKLIYWMPSGDWGHFDLNKTDTDDNGTPDGQEDYDKDGMTTLQEIAARTDPNKSDTDADGVNDGMEISLGSDPLTSEPWSTRDTDHDGLTDLMEIMIGTDYQNADTNGNGMNDGDELNNGGNPATPGPPPPVLPPASETPETPADPAPVNPPSLPAGNYEILTQVKNIRFQKYGYAPFQLLDPPRRYLRMSSYQSFSGGSPESGPLGITGSTTSTIHALTGATATTGDDFVNTGGQPTSPLIRSGSDTLDSYDDPPNEEYDAPGTREYKTTLSNENTTAMMVANSLSLLPEFTDSFQAGTPFAYRNVHQNQLAIDYQKTKFKFRWQQGTTAEQRYALTFLVIFQPEDNPGTSEDESTKNAEVVKTIPWDGQTEESPEYTIDPETYKPGVDGTYSLVPVELISDLNNDGQITAVDNPLRDAAMASGATDEIKDKGTEFIFHNDNLSNGAWDKEDTDPARPTTAKDDDDAEEITIKPGITEGEVWLDHPAISGLSFYTTRECKTTDKVNLSPTSKFSVSASKPFPDKLFIRADVDSALTYPEANPQFEGELALKIKVGTNGQEIEALKMKLTVVRHFGAGKFFNAARDYIFERNAKLYVCERIYKSSLTRWRMCVMAEDLTSLQPVETYHGPTPVAGTATKPVGPFGFNLVAAYNSDFTALINGPQVFFDYGYGWPIPIPPSKQKYFSLVNGFHNPNPIMTDKSHGRFVIRNSNWPGAEYSELSPSSSDDTTPPQGSLLAGDTAEYVSQSEDGLWEFETGQMPLLPAAGVGGLSDNHTSPDRIGHNTALIGHAEIPKKGVGCVFVATHKPDSLMAGVNISGFVDSSITSKVDKNSNTGTPKLYMTDGGYATVALAHKTPDDHLKTVVFGPPVNYPVMVGQALTGNLNHAPVNYHLGVPYYTNVFIGLKSEKPRN